MPGLVAGLLGCLFGVVGIFAFAIVFVPLAAICCLVGLIRGTVGKCAAGIGTSLLAGTLSVFGFFLSPTLLLLTAGALAAGLWASQPATKPMQVVQRAVVTPPRFQPVPVRPAQPAVPAYIPPRLVLPISPGMTAPPGTQAAIQQAKWESHRAEVECRNRRLAGELRTFVASTECSNPRIWAAYQRAGYPYMDLVMAFTTERRAVADEMDRRLITEAEGNAEIAAFITRLTASERQRRGR